MPAQPISKNTEQVMAALGHVMRFFEESPYARRADIADPCDFVAGNPQEMVLPEFVEAITRAAVPRGPDHYAYKFSEPEARAAVAPALRERTGVAFEEEDIALTDGAFSGLLVSMRTVADPGDEIVFLSPPWFFYEAMIVGVGATPVRVKLRPPAFDLPVDAIAASITERTRAVLVNSPHNPTGRIYPEEDLERLASVLTDASERAGRPIWLISDEAYSRIVFDDRPFVSPAAFYPHTMLVYTYGKTLLTPGQRVGYVAIPPTMPDRGLMRNALMASQLVAGHAVPSAIMQFALAEIEPLSIDIKHLQAKRDRMVEGLRSAGYELASPEGTFYLVPKAPIEDDVAFVDRLGDGGVLVLPGTVVEMPGYFRISLTANDDMIDRSLPIFARLNRA